MKESVEITCVVAPDTGLSLRIEYEDEDDLAEIFLGNERVFVASWRYSLAHLMARALELWGGPEECEEE